jgi:hypothetical protein
MAHLFVFLSVCTTSIWLTTSGVDIHVRRNGCSFDGKHDVKVLFSQRIDFRVFQFSIGAIIMRSISTGVSTSGATATRRTLQADMRRLVHETCRA